MNYVEQKFSVQYTVKNAICRSGAKGEINGFKYGSSVRITALNTFEEENTSTNCIDTNQTELIIKIPCRDDASAGILTTKFNKFFKDKNVFIVEADVPRFSNGSYTVTTIEDDIYFINFLNNYKPNSK